MNIHTLKSPVRRSPSCSISASSTAAPGLGEKQHMTEKWSLEWDARVDKLLWIWKLFRTAQSQTWCVCAHMHAHTHAAHSHTHVATCLWMHVCNLMADVRRVSSIVLQFTYWDSIICRAQGSSREPAPLEDSSCLSLLSADISHRPPSLPGLWLWRSEHQSSRLHSNPVNHLLKPWFYLFRWNQTGKSLLTWRGH